MKILVCGEGKNDVGYEYWDTQANQYAYHPGWVQPLLERAKSKQQEIDIIGIRIRSLLAIGPSSQKLRGHGRKAKLALSKAISEDYDMLVFVTDADTRDTRVWKKKLRDLLAGWHGNDSNVMTVACLPMSASESWMLADAVAWKKLGLVDTSALPKNPETIWGNRRDLSSNHPHPFFRRICKLAGVMDSTYTRWYIMHVADLTSLPTRCPVSFANFWNYIRDNF